MIYGLTAFDWAIVAVCLSSITALGLREARRVRTLDDYFMGGRRFGRTRLTLFSLGSSTAGDQVANITGTIFRVGLGGFWFQLIKLLTVPFAWFVAPLVRRSQARTMADFFGLRFNTLATLMYTVFGILTGVYMLAGGLFGSAAVIADLTGSKPLARCFVAGTALLAVAYTAFSGLGAAIVTGTVQGVLAFVLSAMLLPFVIHRIGGFSGLHAGAAALSDPRPGLMDFSIRSGVAQALGRFDITPFFVAMLIITGVVGFAVSPMGIALYGPARSEREARFAATVGALVKRLCSVMWAFTGVGLVVLYLTPERILEFTAGPEAEKKFAERVFALAAHDLLGSAGYGCLGLMLAAMLAGMMGVCAFPLVITSGLWTVNVYKRFLRPEADEAQLLQAARVASIVIAGAATVLALLPGKASMFVEALTRSPIGIGVAFWLGIAWRRFSSWGMIAATAGGWCTWVFLEWQGGAGLVNRFFPSIVTVINNKLEVNDGWIMLGCLAASVILGVGVSLLTPPEPSEKLDQFYLLLRTPVGPGKVLDWFGFGAAWLGVGLIIALTWWLAHLT